MQKKNLVVILFVGVFLLGGSFYAGMQYANNQIQSKQVLQNSRNNGGNFVGQAGNGNQRNSAGQAGSQRGNGVQGGGRMMQGSANGGAGDFATGEVISKDDTSVTIKTRDGGSKIIFISDKTLIDKSVTGNSGDLNVGQQVTVNGKAGTDGSLVAQNIQIRPAQPPVQ